MTIIIEKIIRFHFLLLILLLCNFGLNELVGFGINSNLTVGLKGILYLTGVVLFFINLRPFKKLAIYYSFYVMTPVVLVAFYSIHGIFLGLLSSLVLAPIMPVKADYSKDDIKIYSKFSGFLGRCCEYYATENTLYLFEKFKGTIYTEEVIDFNEAEVNLKNDSILIYADKTYKAKMD
jgi:hypothetical protein